MIKTPIYDTVIIDSPPASNVLIYFFILFRILLQSYSFAYIHLMARFGEYIKRQLWTNSIIKQNFKSKGQNIVNSTFQKKSKVVKKKVPSSLSSTSLFDVVKSIDPSVSFSFTDIVVVGWATLIIQKKKLLDE